VLAAPNAQEAEVKLKLWARFSDSDGGIWKMSSLIRPATSRALAGAHQAGQF